MILRQIVTTIYSTRLILFFVSMGMGLLLSSCAPTREMYTRGIGVYPGEVKEDFSPALQVENATHRNLALRRPAYQSSSYDYNLTAQLVTDGIKETRLPRHVSISTSQHGKLKKGEREFIIDRSEVSTTSIDSASGWIQIELRGDAGAPEVDRLDVAATLRVDEQKAQGWEVRILASDDGRSWEEMGSIQGADAPGELLTDRPWMRGVYRRLRQSIHFKEPAQHEFYRIEVAAPCVESWSIGEVAFYRNQGRIEIAPSHSFTSAWMGALGGEQWVYVDLGAVCTFDKVDLHWIRGAVAGSLQISNDARQWKTVQELSANGKQTEEFEFDPPLHGKFVRVLMKQPVSPEGYVLSEVEVWGRGGPVPEPQTSNQSNTHNRLNLAGGAWKVQRESLVKAGGEALSTIGFADDEWLPATVPGTVLVSYVNAGALPDPNFGDNQLVISESFFNSDFWYRNEFEIPSSLNGERFFLNFDGINWKADVYLNGKKVGRIEGAFTRGKFEVTGHLIRGQKNALAVRIEKNATIGSVTEQTFESAGWNGGALGADNPTFHASVGWDWMPTIRGRNTGIWNDVYLTAAGPVTIEDPFVVADLALPDTTAADINLEVTLQNHQAAVIEGTLRGAFGAIAVELPVRLEAAERKTVKLNPATHPVLRLQNPKLWWPNGYGAQNLYDVSLSFMTSGKVISDAKFFQAGVRELSYSDSSGALKMWINGRRFIGRGGNWGFSESMLRYRAREYDVAVRYHKEMNFTLIRNWVGQTGDDEFYEACDRHGIMVWQDFWLANPWDGPDPADNKMFMQNVDDYVKRIRNHPSLVLYCGRNEGNPLQALDAAMRAVIPRLHPGLHYISHSSEGMVSGGGPYRAMPVKFYFRERATPRLHSELGMPNIPTQESLHAMMPDSTQWPIGEMWGLHDFCKSGAMRAGSFLEMFDQHFGKVESRQDWLTLAQFMNYEGHRAMFEAQGKNRMGLTIWMSHPAWPSFVWQTYDYYFEPTAAYFGCKKASEPLHIQWNAASDSIEVVNYSAGNVSGLTAHVEILNLDGTLKWQQETSIESFDDSVVPCMKMAYPDGLTAVHFLRLRLRKGNAVLSENFYWRGVQEGDYQAIRTLPKVTLASQTQIDRKDNRWILATTLKNPSQHPALMVRLKIIREKSGDRILPVLYSDNYVSLMPGEQRTIRMELQHADTRGEKPAVEITGFNVDGAARQMTAH